MSTTTLPTNDTGTEPAVCDGLVELGRFLALAAARLDAGLGAAEMFSPAVDALWHDLLEAPGYAEFSTAAAGRPASCCVRP
ncbi:hypothetical protein [Kitasatospora sp. NPDC085879]|uniref:hypothetical protein n=1 Tax=Kitasatospora sp. NPDC085879 TaxID=3154769 RepID=UPI000BB1166C|nr:hypothetical protein [Streptomyces sp. TLI_235]PBC69832.1 hypothetical protein BX265_7190 [Streptomyces sp. TLI_235]